MLLFSLMCKNKKAIENPKVDVQKKVDRVVWKVEVDVQKIHKFESRCIGILDPFANPISPWVTC